MSRPFFHFFFARGQVFTLLVNTPLTIRPAVAATRSIGDARSPGCAGRRPHPSIGPGQRAPVKAPPTLQVQLAAPSKQPPSVIYRPKSRIPTTFSVFFPNWGTLIPQEKTRDNGRYGPQQRTLRPTTADATVQAERPGRRKTVTHSSRPYYCDGD